MKKSFKIIITAVMIAMSIFSIFGCFKKGYEKITPEKAKEMMDNESVIVLDVRTASEYSGGHIKNAINISSDLIKEKAEEILTDKDAVILVYCQSGRRSAAAASTLSKMGYTKIYDFGGITSWEYGTVT